MSFFKYRVTFITLEYITCYISIAIWNLTFFNNHFNTLITSMKIFMELVKNLL